MKKSFKNILVLLLVVFLLPVTNLSAQEQNQKEAKYSPKAGDWSIGVSFNPATLAYQCSLRPKPGEASGDYILGLSDNPKQMHILAQDPLATFRFRYVINPSWQLRVTLGFNGSHIDYKEYVPDDRALALNPDSQNKVVDAVRSNLNGGNLTFGAQYMAGKGSLRFIAGFGLSYSIAGGGINFKYGNVMTDINHVPSSMPITKPAETQNDKTLNEFESVLGIKYGRPLRRYNVGYTHGIGINGDMGIEWFMTGRMSLTAAMTFIPVMFIFQPKTYTKYEGFSSNTGRVEEYNSMVSPGSTAVLYGTESIGLNISLNYYF